MRKIIFTVSLLLFLSNNFVFPQARSIISEQAKIYSNIFSSKKKLNEQDWDSISSIQKIKDNFLLSSGENNIQNNSKNNKQNSPLNKVWGKSLEKNSPDILGKKDISCKPNKIVFGWNPYWVGTAYKDYDYSLLTDISYFGYEVNPTDGNYKSIHNWKTTELIQMAKANGVRVNLCVTLFENHAAFFGNLNAQKTLIDSLIALVKFRSANGINIDFEAVPASQKNALTAFMQELGRRVHAEIPNSQISIALPAVDWSNVFDTKAMVGFVDLFLIMGYDYHWSSSSNSGPVSPKNNGTRWSPYDVTRSINYYLNKGVPKKNLCLGVPYYGYSWQCIDTAAAAKTAGKGSAVFYTAAEARANLLGRKWDLHSSTPYYVQKINDTTFLQCWYDDAESLGLKYDLVNMKDIAGVGIWALSYDAGVDKLWNLIENKFTDCAETPCAGVFTDMGGAMGNYYDNDNFTFTIAPKDAEEVTIKFKSFSIANDMLKVYDGKNTFGKLIGSFSATNSPNTITVKSGAMTLEFISDQSTNSWGWQAEWECKSKTKSVSEATAKPLSDTRIEVKVFDIHGDELLKFSCVNSELPTKLSAITLPKGLYFLQQTIGNKVVIEKYLR